ncbi:MAG: alpha/beta fold hydrolase [candidate division NC10 bacterium]|nr:alpha/beta fold hydrolase [candidate division NC10 bacterium]
MEFRRLDDLRTTDGKPVPAYLYLPEKPLGGVALCHGYGGCKEHMVGLGARLAEEGLTALCFDLRGHGENQALFDDRMLDDLEAAIQFLRRYGKVAAIGHSLGGRLVLMSTADLVVAISPAVPKTPSEEGKQILLAFGSTMVKTADPAQILELLQDLGEVPKKEGTKLLVYAKGDIPSLIEGTLDLKKGLPQAELLEITTHQHQPVPLSKSVLRYLHHWFNHAELKYNVEVLEEVPRWLKTRLG